MRSLTSFLFLALPLNAETISADVWVDNWFSLSVNGQKVAEDSVSISTERSFNKESFRFEAEKPFVLAITAKDFKQDDTGLEYIGSRKQQMGDGGLIAQFQTASGVVATDGSWRCLVVHKAPLDRRCEQDRNPQAGKGTCQYKTTKIPKGWDIPGFDDSNWPKAVEWRERDVRPKDGYDKVRWDRSAKLIWSADLKADNTLLCRTEVR